MLQPRSVCTRLSHDGSLYIYRARMALPRRGLDMFSRAAIHFAIFASLFITSAALAKEATVFDERRPLAMQNDQVMPKDYYINAGSNDGLKPGVILPVYRNQ